MKAEVYVMLKPGVLDPQGKAIKHSVESIGYENVDNIRQGKFFEVQLSDALSAKEAKEVVTKIAKDVLSNPVIEDYRVEIVNG